MIKDFVKLVGKEELIVGVVSADPVYAERVEHAFLMRSSFLKKNREEIISCFGDYSFGEAAGKHSEVMASDLEFIYVNEYNIGEYRDILMYNDQLYTETLYGLSGINREYQHAKKIMSLVENISFITVPEDLFKYLMSEHLK